MQHYRITLIFNLFFVRHAHTYDCLVKHNFKTHLFHYRITNARKTTGGFLG